MTNEGSKSAEVLQLLRARLYRGTNIRGKRGGRFRPDLDDRASATEVHLFWSGSIAPQEEGTHRCESSSSIVRSGFTLAKGLELIDQWSCIVDKGPVGVLDWGHLIDARLLVG